MTGRGKFVAFEGIDGTGKGTLMTPVAALLEGLTGGRYFRTRQPGGSACGEAIRDILFKTVKTQNITDDATTLLFLAGLANENEREIEPRLAKGITVVCDRWHASHLAYMAVRKNLTYPVAEASFRLATAEPDLTVLLIGDPKVLLARAQGRPGGEAGKQEAKTWNDVALQTEIQDEFLKLVGSNPSTLVVDTTWAAPEWLFEHLIEPRVRELFAPVEKAATQYGLLAFPKKPASLCPRGEFCQDGGEHLFGEMGICVGCGAKKEAA